MSKYYTAFQFDAAYKPKSLRNWEVPKYFCHRPRPRTGRTQIIANATGNLLPGVHRSEDSPWGNFIGTWSMPKKIDRKTAATINGSAEHKAKAGKCYLHYTAKPQKYEEESTEKLQTETKQETKLEEVASAGTQEERSAREEDGGTVEVPEETSVDQEAAVAEQETVTKPLCPIHDIVMN